MDARGRGREGLAGSIVGDAARAAHDEPLGSGVTFEHVNADAGAAVVMEARVARLPPRVEPGLRVRASPEELEGALARSVESGEVDEPRRCPGKSSALVGPKVVVVSGERLETGCVDHGAILADRAR